MKNQFNVGRGATDSSKRILGQAKLIQYSEIDIGAPRKIHAYTLTPRGRIVAEKLAEIKELLELSP